MKSDPIHKANTSHVFIFYLTMKNVFPVHTENYLRHNTLSEFTGRMPL